MMVSQITRRWMEDGSHPDVKLLPTAGGDGEVKRILAVNTSDLLSEASRVARRHNADAPSKEHVRDAAAHLGLLRSTTAAWSDGALALGSLLAGGGVAYQVNVWTGGVASPQAAVPVAVAFAAGVGLMCVAIVVKIMSR